MIPDPNRDEDVRNFINSQPIVDNRDTINLRLDLGLGEKNLVSAQYSMEDADGIEVHPFPAFGAREQGRVYEGQVSYTRTFNDNTVGSLRAEFDRVEELELARDERPAGLLDG